VTPENFPKAFAAAFAAQNSAALAAMLAPDAQVVTLTGAVTETADEARAAFDQEFAGTFAGAKLVTGRNRVQAIGPGAAIVHQRYVVMGAKDAAGHDLPRFGILVTMVLLARPEGWRGSSLTLSALA
jgi:uncharacterized protein (TIGR02246 family)